MSISQYIVGNKLKHEYYKDKGIEMNVNGVNNEGITQELFDLVRNDTMVRMEAFREMSKTFISDLSVIFDDTYTPDNFFHNRVKSRELDDGSIGQRLNETKATLYTTQEYHVLFLLEFYGYLLKGDIRRQYSKLFSAYDSHNSIVDKYNLKMYFSKKSIYSAMFGKDYDSELAKENNMMKVIQLNKIDDITDTDIEPFKYHVFIDNGNYKKFADKCKYKDISYYFYETF